MNISTSNGMGLKFQNHFTISITDYMSFNTVLNLMQTNTMYNLLDYIVNRTKKCSDSTKNSER